MRYRVGAVRLGRVPSGPRRRGGALRLAGTVPVGPTHAVDAATGAVACGIPADRLEVLDLDWEGACFVEKCPRCFAAVGAQGQA
jgi:hypothetical protein